MKIKIMSRLEAIHYSTLLHKEKSIIVSISEPTTTNPTFFENNSILDVLFLKFDDIIQEELKVVPHLKLMTKEDVYNIKQFIDKYKDKIDTIIVHCHAGVSRSSAVACGICLYLGKDDYYIWNDTYYPNSWCLELMNECLNLGLSKEDIDIRYKINELSTQEYVHSECEDGTWRFEKK